VAIVCEPGCQPDEVVPRLAADLPERLERSLGGGPWDVRVVSENLPLTEETRNATVLRHLGRLRERQGFDVVLCVVDVPMSDRGRPIVADASKEHGAAIVSLPAFGGMHLRRRTGEVVGALMGYLLGGDRVPEPASVGARVGPFRQVVPPAGIDSRMLASRGRQRLLVGMVRANRPWRLVFGLTGALAAALAVAAYVLVEPTDWKLALAVGPLKLGASTGFSVAAMVTWLILDHHLWTRRASSRRAVLYNSSTVLTLVIGVLCMYAGLFVVVAAASAFTMDPGFFRDQIGRPAEFRDHVIVTWLACSLAVVAGALGTGFQSEDDVRQAAYSYRERERRSTLEAAEDEADSRA
jgi:hypothetical protein